MKLSYQTRGSNEYAKIPGTANEFYKEFGITCPLYIEQSDGLLIPLYNLPKPARQEV